MPGSKTHKIEEERDYAKAIVETVREPLVVLDSKLRVITANRSFIRKQSSHCRIKAYLFM